MEKIQQFAHMFADYPIKKDLSLLDRPSQSNAGVSRSGTLPTTHHRPARSQEEDMRRRAPPPRPTRGPPEQTLDIFASPPKADGRRPRRNSESSVMDRDKAEEDRRRRERRREREARREKEGRSKDGKSSKPPRKPQGLDIIDKLDVTGIYGPGLFHHDGPFDACNPHRNRKKDYRAPMQAFPANSANNALGGSGPLNKHIDLDRFHGRGEDAFNDFAASRPAEPAKQVASFNPTDRVEQIHAAETEGLGTSTFLDGAPASKKDSQRRESESEVTGAGGLSRKKSLAVRLRGLPQSRRDMSSDRVSPDTRYAPRSPNSPGQAVSAGGPSRSRIAPGQEKNPFFADYDDAYEKKGATIRVADTSSGGRARAPSSPYGSGLTRSVTAESDGPRTDELPERVNGGGGGFLNRMKSLKGGRRARPERRLS